MSEPKFWCKYCGVWRTNPASMEEPFHVCGPDYRVLMQINPGEPETWVPAIAATRIRELKAKIETFERMRDRVRVLTGNTDPYEALRMIAEVVSDE